jgi:hypothetical protein
MCRSYTVGPTFITNIRLVLNLWACTNVLTYYLGNNNYSTSKIVTKSKNIHDFISAEILRNFFGHLLSLKTAGTNVYGGN